MTESEISETDEVLSLEQAALLVPSRVRGRTHVSPATIKLWILRGFPTPNGSIRLESVRAFGRLGTSQKRLQRFLDSFGLAVVRTK